MPALNLLHVSGRFIGYGVLGRGLSEALERLGVEVFRHLPNPEQVANGDPGRLCGHVQWIATPGHARGWWKGQTVSIFTMWESSRLPEPFRESLDEFELVIVPSEQNLELFSQYNQNVALVPLGIDPADWHPVERPMLDGTWFTFLVSGGGKRKGVDLVVEAFRRVFPEEVARDCAAKGMAVPRLIVKSPRVNEVYGDRIELVGGYLPTEQVKALYALSHVYVQPSRGEGFGLQPLQAIAQGMPTIATDAHGHTAFRDLITYKLPAKASPTPPGSFHHGPAGSWWEPDFEVLCEAMRAAYDDYHKDRKVAAVNAQKAVETFTWEASAKRWVEVMGDRLERPDVKVSRAEAKAVDKGWHVNGTAEWRKPSIRRYRVRVTESHMFEVGGVSYRMDPGQDYWEPADVKRILFDSGFLDPACITDEDDAGLMPEQYEQIESYSASHALCQACGQKLNTNKPTPDELVEMMAGVPAR